MDEDYFSKEFERGFAGIYLFSRHNLQESTFANGILMDFPRAQMKN